MSVRKTNSATTINKAPREPSLEMSKYYQTTFRAFFLAYKTKWRQQKYYQRDPNTCKRTAQTMV
eukprot:3767780-Amphidinium_carterae.2